MAAFLLLCVWSSAGWLTSDLLPAKMEAVAGQALHLLLTGLIALTIQVGREGFPLLRRVGLLRCSLGGFGLIGVPLLLLDAAASRVSPALGVVVFSLVPVAMLVAMGRLGMLVPALAGVAGVLLLVPSDLPGSLAGWEGLVLLLLAAGCTAAGLLVLPKMLRGIPIAGGIAGACLLSAMVFAVAALVTGAGGWSPGSLRAEVLRGLLLDLPEVWLLFWLLRAVEPQKVAVRYLVAPLLTIIEGFAMLRPGLDVRTVMGVALLAAGSFWLLRGEAEEGAVLGLR